jgi:hypothetical protein
MSIAPARLTRYVLAAAAALTMMVPTVASASPLVSFDNLTGQGLGNPPFTLGWEFSVGSRDMLATGIGFFDSSQDGLTESHEMGIFASDGSLLRSGTIAAGTGATLIDQFRYIGIAPLLLSAGQTYRVGAVFATGADPVVFPGFATGFSTVPGITFNGSRFAFGATLADPTLSLSADPAYFGVNIDATAVPEPTTLLLLGSGMVALIRRRVAK